MYILRRPQSILSLECTGIIRKETLLDLHGNLSVILRVTETYTCGRKNLEKLFHCSSSVRVSLHANVWHWLLPPTFRSSWGHPSIYLGNLTRWLRDRQRIPWFQTCLIGTRRSPYDGAHYGRGSTHHYMLLLSGDVSLQSYPPYIIWSARLIIGTTGSLLT